MRHEPTLSSFFSDGMPIVVVGAVLFALAFLIPRDLRLKRWAILPVGPATIAAGGLAAVGWGLLTADIIPRGNEGLVVVLAIALLFFGGIVDAFMDRAVEASGAQPPPKRRREPRRR